MGKKLCSQLPDHNRQKHKNNSHIVLNFIYSIKNNQTINSTAFHRKPATKKISPNSRKFKAKNKLLMILLIKKK